MLINSFENQSNLAEWFEHINHYSVVVTCHKDLKRTEYKIQKNDYVYDMLKVKGSVTALVTCAKSLADNFPPTTTTDTKSESCVIADSVGVVDSVGDSLSVPVDWSFSDDEAENVFNLLMSAKGFVTCDLMYHNGDYVLLNPRSLPDLTSAIRNDGSCIYYNLNDGNSFVCFDSCENWVGFPNFDSVFTTLNSDDLLLFEELVLDRFLALSDLDGSLSNNFPLSNDESLMLSRLKQVIEKYNFDIEI